MLLFLPPLLIALPVVLRKTFLCNPSEFGNGVTVAFSSLPGDLSALYVFVVCARVDLDSVIHLFSCEIYLYASNPLKKKQQMAQLGALELKGTAKVGERSCDNRVNTARLGGVSGRVLIHP